MAVVHSPDSGYAKEKRKWEAHLTQYGAPGRPYEYREYPTRMYKVTRGANGQRAHEGRDANDEHERRMLEGQGFVHGGLAAAYEACDRDELYQAKLAAERHYEVAHGKHSERAVAEIAQHEAGAGARHLPSIPETPIPRRGRKPKGEPVPA